MSRVSILLPFHNASETLDTAVASIINQTLQDWQLLLIDNNADDDSKQIAASWQQRDPRIEVVKEFHQGISYALNTGLQHVNTEFVARMDSDDVSNPQRIEKQLQFLEQHYDIGLVSCRCAFATSSENAEGYLEFVNWQNNIVTPEEHFVNRFIESPVAHPSVMFRIALVEKFGGYCTDNVPEDYELWLRWMENGVRFAKLEEQLLTWNDRPERLSRNHSNYSTKAFDEVKMRYLARWLKQNVIDKRIVVCGTGKFGRTRAAMLETNNIKVDGFTDVKQRGIPDHKFIPVERLGGTRDAFFINFISKRDVRNQVRKLFNDLGFVEMKDFILAA